MLNEPYGPCEVVERYLHLDSRHKLRSQFLVAV